MRYSKTCKVAVSILEIVTFSANAPLFSACHGDLISTPFTISIVLAMNKESMLTDPINWEFFKEQLSRWSADGHLGIVSVLDTANTLFTERSPLLHNPRALSRQKKKI